MRKHDFSRIGKKYPLTDAIKKKDPRNFLELFDLQGNGSMRQMQLLGGARKRQVRGGYRKNLELADSCASHRELTIFKRNKQNDWLVFLYYITKIF